MEGEEEYIEMKLSSPQIREFEFQMSLSSGEREITPSPADDLFYKGKLLPLLLPPRLQMLEKLLQNSSSINGRKHSFDDIYSSQLITTPTVTSTPFEPCNISPSRSCPVSRELNPDDYGFECSSFNGENPGKSWAEKLKQSSIVKLKASKDYLRSLFRKSGCSYESTFAKAMKTTDERSISKAKEYISRYMKVGKKSPFEKMKKAKYNQILTSFISLGMEKLDENGVDSQRRSLSAIPNSTSTSSSSSESFSSSCSNDSCGFSESQFLKRSGSENSDIESPIQGAIAHCKRSQFQRGGIRFVSLSPSRIAE